MRKIIFGLILGSSVVFAEPTFLERVKNAIKDVHFSSGLSATYAFLATIQDKTDINPLLRKTAAQSSNLAQSTNPPESDSVYTFKVGVRNQSSDTTFYDAHFSLIGFSSHGFGIDTTYYFLPTENFGFFFGAEGSYSPVAYAPNARNFTGHELWFSGKAGFMIANYRADIVKFGGSLGAGLSALSSKNGNFINENLYAAGIFIEYLVNFRLASN